MQLKYGFFAILMAAFQVALATNYCNTPCGSTRNIGCNNTGQFASTCTNPSIIPITQTIQNLIVEDHNTKRNLVAGGNTTLEPACRMATMQWDDELASLAELNVKQCEMKHDGCHNTDAFKWSGQNLAWIGFTGALNVTRLVQKSFDMWYNEINDTQMAYINKYPSGYSGPTIGHLTVMMADRNYRLGCGISSYSSPPYTSFLFACNYATTNMINYPIYKNCTTAASDCKNGTNPDFHNLCSVSEVYDVNNWA